MRTSKSRGNTTSTLLRQLISYFVMKTLSATPKLWYRWKAENLSFLNVLLVRGGTLTSLLIKKRQSWALVLRCILFDGIVKKIDKEITLASRGLEEPFFQLCCCVRFLFWRDIGFGFTYYLCT
jgi:hypothetical protein